MFKFRKNRKDKTQVPVDNVNKEARYFSSPGWDPLVSPPPMRVYELNSNLEGKTVKKIRNYMKSNTKGEYPKVIDYGDGMIVKYDVEEKSITWLPDQDDGTLKDKIGTILEYEGYNVIKEEIE